MLDRAPNLVFPGKQTGYAPPFWLLICKYERANLAKNLKLPCFQPRYGPGKEWFSGIEIQPLADVPAIQ